MRKGQIHPSTLLSKNMLGQGMVALLGERSFKEITVTELCDRAQIARRTFYRHFATLEDVLAYYVQGVIAEFAVAMRSRHTLVKGSEAAEAAFAEENAALSNAASQAEAEQQEQQAFAELVLAYFGFWQQHSSLLIQLNKNQLLSLIFSQYIQCLHENPDVLFSGEPQQAMDSFYAPKMAYVSGGLWSVLIYWVSSNCQHTPSELAQMLASI